MRRVLIFCLPFWLSALWVLPSWVVQSDHSGPCVSCYRDGVVQPLQPAPRRLLLFWWVSVPRGLARPSNSGGTAQRATAYQLLSSLVSSVVTAGTSWIEVPLSLPLNKPSKPHSMGGIFGGGFVQLCSWGLCLPWGYAGLDSIFYVAVLAQMLRGYCLGWTPTLLAALSGQTVLWLCFPRLFRLWLCLLPRLPRKKQLEPKWRSSEAGRRRIQWPSRLGVCFMAALVGSYLGVRYNVAGGPLYHMRYICASVGDPAFPYDLVCRTPDGDTYEERYNQQQSIMDVKIATDFQTIPGLPADQIYPFRAAPTPQEEVVWKSTGAAVVAGVIPGLLRPVGGHAPGQNPAGPAGALQGPLGIQPAAGGAAPAAGGAAPAGGALPYLCLPLGPLR